VCVRAAAKNWRAFLPCVAVCRAVVRSMASCAWYGGGAAAAGPPGEAMRSLLFSVVRCYEMIRAIRFSRDAIAVEMKPENRVHVQPAAI